MDLRSGQCLCGAVTFKANVSGTILACHCGQCQRWTGGGPYLVAKVEGLEISGAEAIKAYHASSWGERGVCGTCGSTIYWSMQGKTPSSVAVGLLDDQTGLSVIEEIFVDHRAPWMPPFEGASQATEAEVMARFTNIDAEDT